MKNYRYTGFKCLSIVKPFHVLTVVFFCAFSSCKAQENKFENDYIFLTIPDGWTRVEQTNSKEKLWVTISLFPDYLKKIAKESPDISYIQSVAVSVLDSTEDFVAQRGFLSFIQMGYAISKESFDTGPLEKTNLGGKDGFSWSVTRNFSGGKLLQHNYSLKVDKYIVSFLTTQKDGMKAPDIDKVLKSVKFKK